MSVIDLRTLSTQDKGQPGHPELGLIVIQRVALTEIAHLTQHPLAIGGQVGITLSLGLATPTLVAPGQAQGPAPVCLLLGHPKTRRIWAVSFEGLLALGAAMAGTVPEGSWDFVMKGGENGETRTPINATGRQLIDALFGVLEAVGVEMVDPEAEAGDAEVDGQAFDPPY